MKESLRIYLVLLLLIVLLPLTGTLGKSRAETPGGAAAEKNFLMLNEASGEIISVPDKEFLIGATAAEMPMYFEDEALKAQGVAAYTYYGKIREENIDEDYYFSVNTDNFYIYASKEAMQKRWGDDFDKYYERLSSIADEIYGTSVYYNGELITAAYFAVSSGNTEASADIWGGEREYLQSVASPFDRLCEGCKSEATVTRTEAENIFGSIGIEATSGKLFGHLERTASGSVITAECCGTEVPGGTVRNAFTLRSQNFTVSENEDLITFTVYGYGHGVGMSQTGANCLAKIGYGYRDILLWYYKGCSLSK